jgi:hypothetical protein
VRRLSSAALTSICALLLVSSPACKHRKKAQAADPIPPGMLSVADPLVGLQLTKGFFEVEAGAWRWTQKNFAVVLNTPPNADTQGARLVLQFTLPEPLIQNLKSVTLGAAIDGFNLPTQQYNQAGPQTYSRDLAPDQLRKHLVPVEFFLDKAFSAGSSDTRELGVIARQVGLVAK